jgi:hypothetical protein
MIKSVRLTFEKEAGKLKLARVCACAALPYPTAGLEKRTDVTGTWLELEDKNGRLLYRLDIYGFMTFLSNTGELMETKSFDVLIPYYPETETVSVYAPPAADNAVPSLYGLPSVPAARFALPEPFKRPVTESVQLPADICGKGRGQVIRTVAAQYFGRVENIYNLVILADKFGASEQMLFREKADKCLQFILSRPPFNNMYGCSSVNIYYVEVSSNKRNPSYFNTTYGDAGTHVNWDMSDVKTVCDELFSDSGGPYWNWAAVLINETDERIGTAAGNQFTCGSRDNWLHGDYYYESFQHELGHAAFGFADEYQTEGKGAYTGGEPGQVNITTKLILDQLKWKSLATRGVALPTCNKSKTDVGCYEGAYTYESGIYRPQYNCVMRHDYDADGYYCKVCARQANKLMARAMGMFVPAPGVLRYSNITQAWDNLTVASQVNESVKSWDNYTDFAALISELGQGRVGSAVRAIYLEAAGEAIPSDAQILEVSPYDSSLRGLWYLILPEQDAMRYLYAASISGETEIIFGNLKMPPLPTVTFFDGVVVGQEAHIFCVDGGKLAYGKMDARGIIDKNLVNQTVTGLESDDTLSSVSVDYQKSRIFVGVVDGLKVKLAAYELINAAWDARGFLTMPFTEELSYTSVRIMQIRNTVHVLSKTSRGVVYKTFDTVTMTWNTASGRLIENTEDVAFYDMALYRNILFITLLSFSVAQTFMLNTVTMEWSMPGENEHEIRGAEQGNDAAAITAFGTAVLKNLMHRVLIKGQKAVDEIYEIQYSQDNYHLVLQRTEEIDIINDSGKGIGSFMLHAASDQLHLILSAKVQLA